MAEYSRIAKGHFTVSNPAAAQVINLPFTPDYVEMTNYTVCNAAPAANAIGRAWWDNTTPLTTGGTPPTIVETYTAAGTFLTFDTIATGGISTFSAGLSQQFGPLQQHNSLNGHTSVDFSISQASNAVVTISGGQTHGLVPGNVIVFENLFQTATTGMQQMAGVPMTVISTTSSTFTVNWNTSGSNYTAFNTATSTNNAGSYKQVLYPYLYAPGQAVITAINRSTNDQFTGAANTIQTAAAHNYQVGQFVAFRVPTVWGPTQLNSLPDVLIPGQPIYYTVIAVTQNTFTVAQSLANNTAFTANVPFAGARTFAQSIATGDVNTGGNQITSTSSLYPSPLLYNGLSNTLTSSINGPAIVGSFVNNTSQGFIIGTGAGTNVTGSSLIGAANNVIMWRAYASDYPVN